MAKINKAANYDMEFIKFLVEKNYTAPMIAQIIGVKVENLRRKCFISGLKFSNSLSYILTPNQQQIIIELYPQGYSSVKLANDFGVDEGTVLHILNNSGVTITDANDKIYYHSNFNHDAFEDMTNEHALYFYGLLLADGCLSKNKSGNYNRVEITLKEEDKYMLQNLLDYLGSDNSIRKITRFDKRTNKTYYANSVNFNDTNIVDRLISYGFSARKSLNEKVPPKHIASSRHFWRGMVDGDGCLSKDATSFTLSLVGSEDINKAFNEFVESNIDVITKRKIVRQGDIFNLYYSGNDARQVSKLLYENSTIFLCRKKKLAEDSWEHIGVNLRHRPINNKFGIAGVYLIGKRFKVLFNSKAHSISVTKSFSIKRLGYDEALKQAIELRKSLEKEYS